jgi:hypothetical protein
MQPACSASEADQVLRETEYLLKRWRFAANASGFFWVQPVGPKLSPEELAGFITVLRRACGERRPRVILFDFSEIEIVGGQWTLAESLLTDFSQSLGTRCRLVAAAGRPLSAVLLYQTEGDRGLLASRDTATDC